MLAKCQLESLPTPTCKRMNSLVLCDGDVYKKMLDSERRWREGVLAVKLDPFSFLSLSPSLSLPHTHVHTPIHTRSLSSIHSRAHPKEKARRPPFE